MSVSHNVRGNCVPFSLSVSEASNPVRQRSTLDALVPIKQSSFATVGKICNFVCIKFEDKEDLTLKRKREN